MEPPVRSDTRSKSCNATKEELLKGDLLKVWEDCPICEKLGVACSVGCHPSTATADLSQSFAAKLTLEFESVVERELQKRLVVSDGDSFSNVSFSELAKLQLSALRKKNGYRSFFPSPDDIEAVMSVLEQSGLTSKPSIKMTKSQKAVAKKEGYLCMKITRYLQRLFNDNELLLVNSEESKWIVTVSKHPENFMKPDFFLIRKGLQANCPETGSETLKMFRTLPENSDVRYSFGKLRDWILRDCIRAVIEIKVRLTIEDFGKLVCYLQHLSRNDRDSTFYGMVCDDTDVWLVSCTAGNADTRIDTKWTSAGSARLIREFFSQRNNWCTVLDFCCATLNVNLVENSAFLGCGASGRVFNVVTGEGRQCAMKVVYSGNTADITAVQAELTTLRSIKAAGGHTVTAVDAPAYYRDPLSNEITGIGYLMAEVGVKVGSEECRRDHTLTREVFGELHHLHSLRRYHGDPRLDNLVRHNGKLLWIDFMRTNLDTPSAVDFREFVKHDTKILLQSVFGTVQDSNLLAALDTYASAPSDATMNELLAAAFEAEQV